MIIFYVGTFRSEIVIIVSKHQMIQSEIYSSCFQNQNPGSACANEH